MATHPKNVQFKDKLLPTQVEYSKEYIGKDYETDLYETIIRVSGIGHPGAAFDLEQTDMYTIEQMGSNPVALRLVELLLKIGNARRVLEIGAFIGVSAMTMARALPEDGQVVTIEKFDHFAAIARKNFEKNGLAGKIELIPGDASEIIDRLPKEQPFDFIFIDGNKEKYRDYMEACAPLLAPGGLMAVDDVFFLGDAINAVPTSPKGQGCRDALDYAATLEGWLRLALPLSTGILLLRRL